MINPSVLVLISACYLGLLFWLAFRGDQKPIGQFSSHQPALFTLSLAVYCSSWTFFGAVGTAANSGWNYIAIYLGPILVFLFGYRFLEKIMRVSKREKVTTIADFISARYGKSSTLAALVTLIALVGTIPYIALQLKAVGAAFDTLSGRQSNMRDLSIFVDTPLYLGIALAVFAILFGARRIDATEHHRGLMNAISFESVVKIVALVIMAVFAWRLLGQDGLQGLPDIGLSAGQFIPTAISPSFLTSMLLAAGAIICLPRQFHVTAVESRGDEMPAARWGFPAYLAVVSMAVVPVTLAGIATFNTTAGSDLFILRLPMEKGADLLATLVYIGGFSAATSMVIVAAVALSTMVSNDLILPLLLRFRQGKPDSDYFPFLLRTRQLTICALIALAYYYHRVANISESLASIGLISFAAAIQFLPAMMGSVYWRRGHRLGVISGLIAGFAVWLYTLLLPTLAEAGWVPLAFTDSGMFGLQFFNPHGLFLSDFGDPLTHGVVWSLGLNSAVFFVVSLFAKANLSDRLQATAFIDGIKSEPREQATVNHRISFTDLVELCNRFVGKDRTRRFFDHYTQQHGAIRGNAFADVHLIAEVEQLLSSTIGASSARSILDTALQASGARDPDIINLLSQTTQAIQFNRELLQVTLDNLSQGVSVVDADLRLVAWNQSYLEMFNYPDGFIRTGIPIEDTIRFNARRGLFALEDVSVDEFVSKRLGYLRHGASYSYERTWRNGTVVKTQGNRLPDGGYVTTYTDITDYKNAQRALEAAKSNLELKVEERTKVLSQVNEAMKEARAEAEAATISKTRFLAAASHDLLQPLNAGKLFLGALLEDLRDKPGEYELANNVQKSLQSAEDLLRALLDISKLDAGALKPEFTEFSLSEILASLEREFSVLAREKGLTLRTNITRERIYSDKNLLRSVLQNLVSNAIRYTPRGTVMVCCRVYRDTVVIQVRDSGPGIPEEKQQEIFEEFKRLHHKDSAGLGLGLAITKRIANLLGAKVSLRSAPGLGSTFSVRVTRALTFEISESIDRKPAKHSKKIGLEGLRVLCIDDDKNILSASKALLERWGCSVTVATSVSEWQSLMTERVEFDVILADFQLQDSLSGLDILEQSRDRQGDKFNGVVISAEHDEKLRQKIRAAGFTFLAKPLEPSMLRSLLNSINKKRKKADI